MGKKKVYETRLFSNKKGIAFLDNIGNFLNGIVSLIPPPVRFILFLLLIVAFSYVLSIIFNSFGTYCNSANLPVKLNANILSGISLIGQTPDPKELGKEQYNLEELGFITIGDQATACSKEYQSGVLVFNSSQLFLVEALFPPALGIHQIYNFATASNTKAVNFTEPTWFYDGTFCTACTKVSVCNLGTCEERCLGDVARLPDDQQSIWQRSFCGSGFGCEPPNHYYYRQSINKYVCGDNTCSGITVGQLWDEKLSKNGATLLYPDQNGSVVDKSSNGFVGIACSGLAPRLAIFGVDMFSFTIWIFILLIVILFWAWKNF